MFTHFPGVGLLLCSKIIEHRNLPIAGMRLGKRTMKSNLIKSLVIFVFGMAAGGLFIGMKCGGEDSWQNPIHAQSPLKDKNKGTPVYQLQKAFHDVYELYKDSVVFISTEKTVQVDRNPFFDHPFFRDPGAGQKPRTQKQRGLGTGFIISRDGYICTNHHVIAGMDAVKVKVGDKEYMAEIIGSDKLTDIALLKIKDQADFKPVYLGDSDQTQVGDWAIAIGNPFGLDRTFTVGVISATIRQDEIGNSHIQTDASINPGNSGGPLINLDGEVIGVNRMIYSKSGGYMGIGFAIPMNTAKHVLDDLRKFKKVKRGWIGVQIAPLTEEFARELGLPDTDGALVGSVMEDGPAGKAGIKERDVILMVDNKKVKRFRDLLQAVSRTPVGKTVKLQVWRDKRKIELSITIKERPSM